MMVFTVFPIISLFTTALAPENSNPNGFSWPAHPHWHNFVDAWKAAHFLPLIGSSTLIVLGVVPASIVISTLAGFALGHLRVPGGKVVGLIFVFGLTLPAETLITPLYYQSQALGLLGTRWAVILPLIGLFMPFSVFWMRTHFASGPVELTEAARLDGASTWQVFRFVHLPLARPAISALAILLFLWTWNQFLLPMVLVNDPTRGTVAEALGAFQGQHYTNIVLICAAALLMIAPSLIVFLVFQRHFLKALLQGSHR